MNAPPCRTALAALVLTDPSWLWGLLLVPVLVVLHLHRRRRFLVPFLPLLEEALGPRRATGGWRRLRDLVPLLLRLSVLGLLILALAGLGPALAGKPPEALLVVVDADATTGVREADGRSRYRHALDQTAALLRSRPWAEVSVLEARETPLVLLPPTSDLARAARAVGARVRATDAGSVAPGPGAGDLAAAVAVARTEASTRPHARIVVLTARPFPEPAAEAGGPAVLVEGTGDADDDQGIRDARLLPAARLGHRTLRLVLGNASREERRRSLLFVQGGREVGRETVVLPPRGRQEVLRDVEEAKIGEPLVARLLGPDAWAANDVATVWVPPAARPSVLVVHDGPVRPYVRAVLEAMGDEIDQEGSGTVSADLLDRATPRDVTIVDGAALPAASLHPGGWLFLAPLRGDLPFQVGEPLDRPLVWRVDADHPLVRDLDLGAAIVTRAWPVSAPGLHVLAEAAGKAVLGEGERDGLRYVVLGLDPEGSDLPLRAAFPLLVRNAVRRLAAEPRSPLAPVYRAGQALRPVLPLPGGPEADVAWDGGRAKASLAPGGAAWRIPDGVRGEVTVTTGGSGGTDWTGHTAVLGARADADVAPARPAAALATPAPPAAEPRRRWRRALLTAALFLLLLDGLLLARRTRGRPGKLAEGGGAL